MSEWSLRVETDEVEFAGTATGFNHTSIGVYGPGGTRGATVELVRGGEIGVTFQSAEERLVDANPQSFISGLTQGEAEQILAQASEAAQEQWVRGGGYELPSTGGIFSRFFGGSRNVEADQYIHNSNAFGRLVHDNAIAIANARGYGVTTPIVDDVFGLPAPGWEYNERFGYHPNIPDVGPECFGPETPIDMWPLDPEFAPDPSNPNKVFDQDAVRAKIWKKPIAMIRMGDVVVSFDKNDNLMPGRVTRTFENDSKILLDYFGTRVTPGHVYFRPDSKKADKFECLLDILRDDGMIQNVEGKNIRAATNVLVGNPRDGFVWAITQERKDGILVEKERGRIRLGTRFIVGGKTSQCVADVIEAKGGVVSDDELIRFGDADPAPFVWEHGAMLPKPEDFVLQASGTTLTDIYKAGEWESRRPHMPAPMVMDGGPVQPLSATALSAMPRNQPLDLQSDATLALKSTERSSKDLNTGAT